MNAALAVRADDVIPIPPLLIDKNILSIIFCFSCCGKLVNSVSIVVMRM